MFLTSICSGYHSLWASDLSANFPCPQKCHENLYFWAGGHNGWSHNSKIGWNSVSIPTKNNLWELERWNWCRTRSSQSSKFVWASPTKQVHKNLLSSQIMISYPLSKSLMCFFFEFFRVKSQGAHVQTCWVEISGLLKFFVFTCSEIQIVKQWALFGLFERKKRIACTPM